MKSERYKGMTIVFSRGFSGIGVWAGTKRHPRLAGGNTKKEAFERLKKAIDLLGVQAKNL